VPTAAILPWSLGRAVCLDILKAFLTVKSSHRMGCQLFTVKKVFTTSVSLVTPHARWPRADAQEGGAGLGQRVGQVPGGHQDGLVPGSGIYIIKLLGGTSGRTPEEVPV
jgi:hypothetical protein